MADMTAKMYDIVQELNEYEEYDFVYIVEYCQLNQAILMEFEAEEVNIEKLSWFMSCYGMTVETVDFNLNRIQFKRSK